MEHLISIILNCYSPTAWQRHMDMCCLAQIRRFTDMPYEIIVVDNKPTLPIRDEYKVLNIDKYIPLPSLETVYESYNIGADLSDGEYLVFMQNDVFCHEKTINKLCSYLKKYDVAFPQQLPLTREQVLTLETTRYPEFGWRDAGMLAITKEAFKKSGGWDERFKNLLGEAAFYARIDNAQLKWTCQTNALITHIMAANNLSKDSQTYSEQMAHDAELLKEYRP